MLGIVFLLFQEIRTELQSYFLEQANRFLEIYRQDRKLDGMGS